MDADRPGGSDPTIRQSAYRPKPAPKRNISHESRLAATAPVQDSPQAAPAPTYVPPVDAAEAQRRFWTKYGPHLLDAYFGETITMPETVEAWVTLAQATQQIVKARLAASEQLHQKAGTGAEQ